MLAIFGPNNTFLSLKGRGDSISEHLSPFIAMLNPFLLGVAHFRALQALSFSTFPFPANVRELRAEPTRIER